MDANDTDTKTAGYAAARRGAALFDRVDDGQLDVRGPDRVGWLQGLLTNDVEALAAGDGCYAAYLTPQGRMISDLRVLAFDDRFLLDVPAVALDTVRARFEQFIIMEDVTVTDVTADVARLAVHGPRAPATVAHVLAPAAEASGGPEPIAARLSSLSEHQHLTFDWSAGGTTAAVVVASSRELGEHGFDLYVGREYAAALRAALVAAGAAPAAESVLDTLRIEAGRPRFGRDMDGETIPLEAGIESRAISDTKGCYVGQEIIVRVRDRGRGRVARRLVGLMPVTSDPGNGRLAPGDALVASGKSVGHLTSVAFSPALSRTIALGYVHRDHADAGSRVDAGEADAPRPLVVTPLPFVEAADVRTS